MIRRPPISTRTDPLFPYTTLCRSPHDLVAANVDAAKQQDVNVLGHGSVYGRWPGFEAVGAIPEHPLEPRRLLERALHSHPQIGRATSELQSLMRISYAVFCLKKNKTDQLYQTPSP